jgi:type III pantothenate kinase
VLLAVDVGNLDVAFGVFDGEALVCSFHAESTRARTVDEWALLCRDLTALAGVTAKRLDAAVVASVAPSVTPALVGGLTRLLGRSPTMIEDGGGLGLEVRVDDPREVGADRLVNALAAHAIAKGAAIVVDFGTATIFDCVAPDGAYVGGVIAPGVSPSADALFAAAARLPRVDLVAPARAIGKNTRSAVQSGLVLGFAGLVDEMVARLVAELGFPCRTLATGAHAEAIAPHARSIDQVCPTLSLDGLRIAWTRSRSSAE